jgi:hypothetical protein
MLATARALVPGGNVPEVQLVEMAAAPAGGHHSGVTAVPVGAQQTLDGQHLHPTVAV